MKYPSAPEGTNETCQRCGDRLNRRRIEWMELSCYTGLYHINGITDPKEDESQGWFPFGTACAQTQLKEQTARTA